MAKCVAGNEQKGYKSMGPAGTIRLDLVAMSSATVHFLQHSLKGLDVKKQYNTLSFLNHASHR